MNSPRYLVLRGGATGDFILTLPALQALRSACPYAEIELACYPHIGGLALAAGLVDRITSLDRREFATIFSNRPQFDTEFVDYILGFEAIISYLYDPDQVAVANLNSAGAKRVIYGNPIIAGRHATDQLNGPLDELDLPVAKQRHATLQLAREHLDTGRQRAHELGGQPVVIHPGSGSPTKNWPLENYIALAGLIGAATGVPVVFSVGEADHEIEQALAARQLPVLKGLSLVELAAMLAHARAYVGNDSGITHLAAAMGIPVVGLFGPTDPSLWAPRGPNVRVVGPPGSSADLELLPVDRVAEAFVPILGD